MKKLYVTVSDAVYENLEKLVSKFREYVPSSSKSSIVNMSLQKTIDLFLSNSSKISYEDMINAYVRSFEL